MNENYITCLVSIFDERVKRNKYYSWRAFARDLGIDNSKLSRIRSGEINISPKLAFKIGKELELEGAVLLEFISPTLIQ